MSYRRFSTLVGAGLLAALVMCVAPARAATFTVLNLSDSGPGSLRQAILDANASPGADTITFAPGLAGQITLEGPPALVVHGELTIQGPGAFVIVVSAGANNNVLVVSPGAQARVSGLGLTGGSGGAVGGAIVNAGNLTVTDAVFSGNSAGRGGAIANVQGGELMVERSDFLTNSADEGSAIYSAHAARIFDSTFIANSGSAALMSRGDLMNVIRSTFTLNVGSEAGAIDASDSLIVNNSTLFRNSGTFGAISITNGSASVAGSTIVENSGGGIRVVGQLFLSGSIVANNFGFNCNGVGITDLGNNLTWPVAFCPGTVADPLLDPTGLADNGGPTQTIALTPESPAVDAYGCAAGGIDQRGVARPQGPACDIGAFELEQAASPEELVESVLDGIVVLAGSSDPKVADKAEDARDKLQTALAELGRTPPDRVAALGALEGAAGELEAMVKDGLLEGDGLLDDVAEAARLLATDAIDAAVGGDPDELADANQALAEGDALRDEGRFKDAIGKYKDAFSKAKSA